MTLRMQLGILGMTTALVAASATGAWAQATAAEIDLSTKAQALDITTYVRAMHGMPVVNHRGEPLGQLYDVVVDFSGQDVVYALMSTGNVRNQDQEQATGTESGTDQGQAASGDLYPIPIAAIKIVDRSALESQVSQGQQQTGEGQQQMAEGEQTVAGQQDTEGQQQMPQSWSELTVGQVIGMPVRSDGGEEIADIEAFVQGSEGRPLAVLGIGGFLGIGEKTVGVPVERLWLGPEGDTLILGMTLEQLENARELEYDSEHTMPDNTPMAQLTTDSGQQEQQAQEGQAQEGQAQKQPAEQDQQRAQGRVESLEGKVLMISIERDMLEQAPSFQVGDYPLVADPAWQESVLAFYEDLLDPQDAGAAATGAAATTKETNTEVKTVQ